MAPCTPQAAHAAAARVTLSFERTAADQHNSRAWMHTLGVVRDRRSPWAHYLQSVYGDDVALPFDVRRLRWFWWWAPGAAALTRIEAPVWRTIHAGDAWVPGLRSERHLAAAGFFIHPIASNVDDQAAPVGGVAEVMKVAQTASERNSTAFGLEAATAEQTWYWHAPGSGIYLRLGKSLVVPNRSSLLAELAARMAPVPMPASVCTVHVSRERGLKLCEGCAASPAETWRDFQVVWPASPAAAARRGGNGSSSSAGRSSHCARTGPARFHLCDLVRQVGFDTVQLTAAFGQRFEIIDCRASGERLMQQRRDEGADLASSAVAACPAGASAAHLSSHAPNGALAPCVCGASSPPRAFLHCGTCARPAAPLTRRAQSGRAKIDVRGLGSEAGSEAGSAAAARAAARAAASAAGRAARAAPASRARR